jgi:hypothetical protein
MVTALARRQTAVWSDPVRNRRELGPLRRSNPEWDFMGRTFTVLSLAELSVSDPQTAPANLAVIDSIIAGTLELERQQGPWVFLMSYSKSRPFNIQPARSLFIDGEIALMIGARRLVSERHELVAEFQSRIRHCVRRMTGTPSLLAESYPDECWTLDHAAALAALRMSDCLDGTDYRPFCRTWLDLARRERIDTATGLLASTFSQAGALTGGPEGSSIWFTAHCLRLVDTDFAGDQYRRAKHELARTWWGFGWSREWPASRRGGVDIDSGVVIPILDASPGGSGLALVGAAGFGDRTFLNQLAASLHFAAFPETHDGELRFAASNQVGDAVTLYAFTTGPLWDRIAKGGK